MRILLCEGGFFLREAIKRSHPNITCVSAIYDLIYYVFYDDMEIDIIIIGDELEEDLDFTGTDEEVCSAMSRLKDCQYFPVGLGEVCRELSRKKGKKEPKIIVMSTFNYYLFNGALSTETGPTDTIQQAKKFVENNNMKCLDKRSTSFAMEIKALTE